MTTPYGPWATAIDAEWSPQLSSFWRQRLTMLVPASQTSPVLSRRNLLGLVAAAFFTCALPAFLAAPAVAEQEKALAEKGGDRAADAGTKDSAVSVSKEDGGKKQITNSIGMKLVLIPAGEFKMGSAESAEATAAFFNKTYGSKQDADVWFMAEHPQHRVRITRPFYLGAYHVTRGQFRQFVNDTGYETDGEKPDKGLIKGQVGFDPDGGKLSIDKIRIDKKYSWRNAGFEQTDEHPVVNVSWNDAVAFCKWLSRKEGNSYRLPTETEWEYACRAGATTRYYSGDDPETLAKVGNVGDATLKANFLDARCTIKASDGYAFTSPVGSFQPNAFGLYDMHGNACQWCSDWYGREYYAASPTVDPTGPNSGDSRVLRGSSWESLPAGGRSAQLEGAWPTYRTWTQGFRVARTERE